MSEIEIRGKKIDVDNEGFLVNYEDWDETVAAEIARREKLTPLTEYQMDVIKFMRQFHKKHQAFPILNYVCKNVHQHRECVSEEFINPMKAWKIAGLPKPDLIHFVTVDGTHYMMEECC